MGRLLAALRRIEARTDAVSVTTDEVVDAPLDASETHSSVVSLVETPAWSTDVHDPWPGAFDYQAAFYQSEEELTDPTELWPAPASEEQLEIQESSGSLSEIAPCEIDNTVAETDFQDPVEVLDFTPPQESTLDPAQAASPAGEPELASLADGQADWATIESAPEPILVPSPQTIAPTEETEIPASSTVLAAAIPSSAAEEESTLPAAITEPPPASVAPKFPAAVEDVCPHAPAMESSIDEVVTVRLPNFGRPQRQLKNESGREGVAYRQSALVPFLPAAERPYREACEGILNALPRGQGVALVLTWSDDDLDHALASARLAETFAERMEDPVLLLDLGKSRQLSSLLRAPSQGSLTEALAGVEFWRDLIVQTGTAGLCLLPSGPRDFEADPVSVARLIEACKEDFSIVLLAGGPLSTLPDNLLLAADAAVLLVEAGHTCAPATVSAVERLRRCGADLLGCLMTGAA